MREAYGDLWEYPADIRVITTNGIVKNNGAVVMGRGCARQARDKYPGIDKKIGTLITRHGNRAFRIVGTDIATMPVKTHWKNPAEVPIIVRSCMQLVEMADKFGWESIVVPRPGCGNGQLSWNMVKPSVEAVLDDRFTVITYKEESK